MMTRVDLVGLTKHFGSTYPVEDFSLTIEPGRVTALLGPSGSGKTTLLKMIAGVLRPTSGDILFDGESVLDLPAPERDAPMVFHNALLFPHLTVEENVGFGLRMRKTPPTERSRRVAEMLELVSLQDLGTRRPDQLSGGQQQRVALARALVIAPRLLLLDEPLANLDPDLRSEMRELLLTVQRSLGLTVLLVTHDQEDAIVIADHVALIRSGSLVQEGVARDFFERPASAWVARFFGAGNLISGERTNNEVTTPLGRLRVIAESPASGTVMVTIRPEAVVLDAAEGQVNTFRARVIAAEFRGSYIRMQLTAGGIDLEATTPVDDAKGHAVGDTVRVALPPEKLWSLPAG
jgi:putative spermidine/putrescine transport system ATP-binding protein